MDIPVSAAKEIAEKYDYDQVIIIARKVGRNEHCTTYSKDKEHCSIAARCGDFLKYKVMGWHKDNDTKLPGMWESADLTGGKTDI